MDIYAKIAQKVKEIAGTDKLQAGIFPAKISEVTGNTCSILVDELELTDVRLKSVIDSEENQLLITPAKGSYVLVADLSGGTFRDLAVISYSQIEKVELKIEEISLVVDKKGVVFNDGKNGGLTITPELKTQLEKLTARVDGIIDAVKSGIPIPQDGGVGLQTTISTALDLLTDKEDFSNIENEKIKQ